MPTKGEYHQQNVAILGAPEGEVVEVVYNRRWVQPGLAVEPGAGCAIVFADSPYEYFVPVRFGVLQRVEETDSRVTMTCRLGAFVRPGALEPLNDRWSGPDRPVRPGDCFLFEDANPGLVGPRSLEEAEEAWREAVDALGGNGFFQRTSVARLDAVIDESGRELDDTQTVSVGSTVTASRIRDAVAPGDVIQTLGNPSPNRIHGIGSDGVLVSTPKSDREGRGPQLVPMWMIDDAWRHLTRHGVVDQPTVTDGLNIKRSAFVMALLARFDGVRVLSTRPTTLEYVPRAQPPGR